MTGKSPYIRSMPAKKPPDPNEKPQKQRFIEMAREIGVDESPEALERALEKILPKPKQPKPKR